MKTSEAKFRACGQTSEASFAKTNAAVRKKPWSVPISFISFLFALLALASFEAAAAPRTYFMYFNTGTVLTQPAVTTNITCPVAADTNKAIAGISLLADAQDATCVPAVNRDAIWSNANTLSLYYNGAGYASAMDITGTSVGVRARGVVAGSILTVNLFYTTPANAKVYFTGTPGSVAVNTTRADYTISLAGLSAMGVPAGSKLGIEFSWVNATGMRLSVNQSAFNNQLIVCEGLAGSGGSSCPPITTYYHDTTNGVNIGFDGLTNVDGKNQVIPPIITASLNPVSTCPVPRARSKNHPTGLYTHSRWYLNADYTVATNIGANPSGSASLSGKKNTDTVTVSLYDYDPVTGAKVLIGSSPVITLTGDKTQTTYPYTINSPLYTVPAGHRLMLEYTFNQKKKKDKASVYCDQLASFINVTESVATSIHHLRIEHSGNGVTCTPATLTIKACADASCSSLFTGGVTGTMTATGTPTVNWVGGAGFSIGASGSTTKDVQVTTAGTVDWGTSGAPGSATDCFIGATPSCSFTSALAGFLFDVPNHVSDTVQNITVSAVKQADNSLACVPAFASTSKTVNFACAYSNPASGTLPVTVGGSAVSCGVGGGVSLSFDASGIASTTVQYADVGQIALTASYSGSGGSETGLVMTGNDSFIAAPASFSVTGVTPGPIKAGNDFSATVTALNASGNATPNFGNETAPEGVTLTSTLVSPVGGANPALGNGVIAGATFSNGVATLSNLNWGEVGNITLDAALTSGSYLGSGLSATGSAAAGVFIPDHFSTEVLAVSGVPMPCPTGLTCPTLYNGFVYSGQSFSVRVTALNLGDGTTSNYDGVLGFSKAVTLTAWDAPGSTTTQNPNGSLTNAGIAAASFGAGVATTTTPFYTLTSAITAPTDIYLRATDTDGATSLRTIPASSVEGGVKVVNGRVKVTNAYGSSLLPLTLPTTVQYYDGTRWLVSATDSITTLSLPANLTVGAGPGTTTTSSTPPGWVFASGSLSINLSAPAPAGASGSVSVAPTIDVGSPGNPPLPIISGTATFGIYKGNNEMIYRREAY